MLPIALTTDAINFVPRVPIPIKVTLNTTTGSISKTPPNEVKADVIQLNLASRVNGNVSSSQIAIPRLASPTVSISGNSSLADFLRNSGNRAHFANQTRNNDSVNILNILAGTNTPQKIVVNEPKSKAETIPIPASNSNSNSQGNLLKILSPSLSISSIVNDEYLVRIGSHGDGTCLAHSIMLVVSEAYQNSNSHERSRMGVTFRKQVGDMLQEINPNFTEVEAFINIIGIKQAPGDRGMMPEIAAQIRVMTPEEQNNCIKDPQNDPRRFFKGYENLPMNCYYFTTLSAKLAYDSLLNIKEEEAKLEELATTYNQEVRPIIDNDDEIGKLHQKYIKIMAYFSATYSNTDTGDIDNQAITLYNSMITMISESLDTLKIQSETLGSEIVLKDRIREQCVLLLNLIVNNQSINVFTRYDMVTLNPYLTVDEKLTIIRTFANEINSFCDDMITKYVEPETMKYLKQNYSTICESFKIYSMAMARYEDTVKKDTELKDSIKNSKEFMRNNYLPDLISLLNKESAYLGDEFYGKMCVLMNLNLVILQTKPGNDQDMTIYTLIPSKSTDNNRDMNKYIASLNESTDPWCFIWACSSSKSVGGHYEGVGLHVIDDNHKHYIQTLFHTKSSVVQAIVEMFRIKTEVEASQRQLDGNKIK